MDSKKAANRANDKGHVSPRHRFAAERVSESCYLNNSKCPDRKNMFGHFSYFLQRILQSCNKKGTNRNLTKEWNCMKKEIIIKILLVIALILTVLSLVFHNDITLIIAAILMAVCIVISFAKKQ